jgi:N-acetylglucosamine kinase-like BadF-type ATPase
VNKKLKNTYIARNFHVYLLVDSGSTKADWVLFDHQTESFFLSEGINPSTHKSEYIQNQIATIANKFTEIPEKIFFYGAGCSSELAKNLLKSILQIHFNHTQCFIYSDLLAAGRALCKGQEAIICILGTGSHAALCDGHQITHQLPALGYLIGDEGSGNHLGKEILRAYFYNKLDDKLKSDLATKHPELLSNFIYDLYHTPNPSSTLARFAQFIIENKQHEICKNIIVHCFELFINSKLQVYKKKSHLPVHLCGSVAYFLKDEMEMALQQSGFTSGDCIQKPIHQLLEYHRRELKIKSEE